LISKALISTHFRVALSTKQFIPKTQIEEFEKEAVSIPGCKGLIASRELLIETENL